jgi:hypothetical protein
MFSRLRELVSAVAALVLQHSTASGNTGQHAAVRSAGCGGPVQTGRACTANLQHAEHDVHYKMQQENEQPAAAYV